jgi:hypothetical protein
MEKEIETKEILNWQRLATTVGIVLVTAAAVGGTVWYLMDQNAQNIADSNAKSISEIQKQVDELRESSKVNNTLTPTADEVAKNIFDINSAKAGDKYGDFVLKTISSYSEWAKSVGQEDMTVSSVSLTDLQAVFTGQVTINVDYTYTAEGEPGMFGQFLKFAITDTASLKKMPIAKGDNNPQWFGLSSSNNVLKAITALGLGTKGKSGTARIAISGYDINKYPSEVFNTATFVDVVK